MAVPRNVLLTFLSVSALLNIVFAFAAHTTRGRLNVVQIVAMLFFLCVAARCGTNTAEAADSKPAASSRIGLWLALITGLAVWTAMIPSYFIDDDFAHLALAQRPVFQTLWDLSTRGQLGTFLRPVGFVTIFLDYHFWGYTAAGYHLTNLVIHLASVAGIFYLSRNLEFGSETATFAALIFSILPIETEAVAWMGARFDLLSGCFMIWSASLYVRFRENSNKALYVASLACFGLAALSKENSFVFPFMLLALECLLMKKRRILPVAGFFIFAAALFTYRWLVLGGIGGYAKPGGAPIVLAFGIKTLQGLLVRAPALVALGFNWVEPSFTAVMILVSLTGALLLTLAAHSESKVFDRMRVCFCIAWLILPMLPAHPLLLINGDLTTSRILYLSAAGLSLLVSQLLTGIRPASLRIALAGALVVLYSLGTLHNIGAWRSTSELQKEFVSEIQRLEPSPPANALFVFHDLPEVMRGVFFMRDQLPDVVQMALARSDVSAVRFETLKQNDGAADRPVIHIQWKGGTQDLIAEIPR